VIGRPKFRQITHRLEGRIEILVVAVIEKIAAQGGDVGVGGNAERHVDGEHRRAGMRGGVGFGFERLDVDVQAREEIGKAVDDAGLVERGDFDGVRDQRFFRAGGAGALLGQRQAESRPLPERASSSQCVPAAGDPHQQREAAAEHGHARFFDIAAGFADAAGEAFHQANFVFAAGGKDE
jgi:hypothetical protein